jgi:hypothetical protein
MQRPSGVLMRARQLLLSRLSRVSDSQLILKQSPTISFTTIRQARKPEADAYTSKLRINLSTPFEKG